MEQVKHHGYGHADLQHLVGALDALAPPDGMVANVAIPGVRHPKFNNERDNPQLFFADPTNSPPCRALACKTLEQCFPCYHDIGFGIAAGDLPPFVNQILTTSILGQKTVNPIRQILRSPGIEVQRRVPVRLSVYRDIRCDHWSSACHRLDPTDVESLRDTGTYDCLRVLIELSKF